MKVAGNGVPGAVGQGRVALLSGLEVAWINGAGDIRQNFACSRSCQPWSRMSSAAAMSHLKTYFKFSATDGIFLCAVYIVS